MGDGCEKKPRTEKRSALPLPLLPHSIAAQRIAQGRYRGYEEIVSAPHGDHLGELPQPGIDPLLIHVMQRGVQQAVLIPLPRRLPDQRIVSRARSRERLGVAPALLHEAETVFQAALVASEEETALLVFVVLELGAVGDTVADHAGHFHAVGGGAGVDFADMGPEGADVFVDALVFEVVGECEVGFGGFGGVVVGEQGDRSSFC